ncbi:MAG: beta-N-acetylhexosaminidase [Bacteroidales bacterium]|nr:beta-N-acetylhexosaminidase [Bacteroidales bacterium]
MKRFILSLAILAPVLAWASKPAVPEIVPMPQKIEMAKGSFKVKGVSINCDPSVDAATLKAVRQFADRLSLVSGKMSDVASPIGLAKAVEAGKLKGLYFLKDASVAPEGYKISIGKRAAVVRASDYNGFFYAIQTLKQMLPVSVYGSAPDLNSRWFLPCCEIEDAPRFSYRGILLDCCRHFFSVDEVKKVLDIMSMFKINRFHWHLTEDQGWRIEIDKYPKLTEIGAFRDYTIIKRDINSSDGTRHGGFYTKAQIRDIVAYAQALGITIIPEVDMPGHMVAALASYPELGCAGSEPQPYKVRTYWGVSKQVLNVGKEETMRFLEDVCSEVADLFPGEYFNIGGDECPKDEWKTDPDCQAKIKELGLVSDEKASAEARLQNYVTARMQKFLATKGKKIIGWDEILEGELAEGATVMSWRGTKGGIKAASMGYDVVMSPNIYCYLDHCQSTDLESEPYCITRKPERAVTMPKLYGYEPYEGMDPSSVHHILGVQGNLWTEFIGTNEYLEYMLLPRLIALSEVQWCKPENKDYDRFIKSLEKHELPILDLLGYNYRTPDELKK